MLVSGDPEDADVARAVTVRPSIELSKFYLVAAEHGSGAATELMTVTLAWARETSARSVWLGVNQLNDRANRFYASSGFVVVGTKRFAIADRWEDDFVRELVFPT